jgi:hypothetical protein
MDISDETVALVLDTKGDFFDEWQKIYKKLELAYNCKNKVPI